MPALFTTMFSLPNVLIAVSTIFRRLEVGHVVAVGDGVAAHLLDLGDHLLRGSGGGCSGAVEVRAQVVHDDLRAQLGHEQCFLSPDTPARAGDDCDLVLQQHPECLLGEMGNRQGAPPPEDLSRRVNLRRGWSRGN
jgi:hypothetical protein